MNHLISHLLTSLNFLNWKNFKGGWDIKPLQKFNFRIFWILVYTVRQLIFRNSSADFSFYLKKIGNHHINHVLSQILYSDMLFGILLVHPFFTELFTKTIIDILFLWKAVANIFWAPKYLVNCYPHKFTIPLLE